MSFAFLAPSSVLLRPLQPGHHLNVSKRTMSRHPTTRAAKACFQIPGVDMEARAKAKAAAAEALAKSGQDKVELGPWDEKYPKANLLVLVGRLGADPILRQVGRNGTSLCTFSLAVNSNDLKLPDGSRHTSWFSIKIWGTRGERAAEMLRKGLRVGINGKVGVDEYVDKKGQKRTSVSVNAKSFEILQSKSEFGSGAAMGGAFRSYNASSQNNTQSSFRRNSSYASSSNSSPPPSDTQDPF